LQAFLALEAIEPPTARSAPPEALEGCLEFLEELVQFLDMEAGAYTSPLLSST